jgi:uncharacterized protein (DUF2062 family)
MMASTKALLGKWMEALLHIHDTPRRTAAAFALGIFFGFSPFLGLHTILALAVAFLFNLNRVAVLVGVYANLPWFLPAWYGLTTAAGAWMLGTRLPPGFVERVGEIFSPSLLHAQFWRQMAHDMRPLLWPYVLGSLVGCALLAALSYYLTAGFIETKRRHHLPEFWHHKPQP